MKLATVVLMFAVLSRVSLAEQPNDRNPGSEPEPKLPVAIEREILFAADVKPILEAHCWSCHGRDARESGLRLDRRDLILQGGDTGKVVAVGQSQQSRLIHLISGADPDSVMPPDGERLTDAQIGILRAWIDQGLSWPETESASDAPNRHWSYQPVRPTIPPEVLNEAWVRNPVDRFVLSSLEKRGMTPSVEAGRPALMRRLSLDLTGLLPTPEELEAFLVDDRSDAVETLVDRYLDSPHFGERWGRHWLDMARYADSDGYEKDNSRPDAWLFRDWVINAINQDMPFDRFTIEQLAGDLLPDAAESEKLATAFHRQTLTNTEGGADQEEFRVEACFDRTETTGSVWLGLTVGCARCHSHKYDAITQREYYQLFSLFNNSDETTIPVTTADGELKARVISQRTANPRATWLLRRGEFLHPVMDLEVQPAAFDVLPKMTSRQEGQPCDRLDFAHWLVSPDHPLTSRVAVNHIWRLLFGQGIVRTPGDFGVRGELPSHPELLDWLALDFVTGSGSGKPWSRKALIRRIVTSATYRQSSASREEYADTDPQNIRLARQNRIRVEAEIIRDISLDAAGLLSRRIGGPGVYPPLPPGIAELSYAGNFKWKDSEGEDRYRRGMYTYFKRTAPHPNLIAFDCPDANLTCVSRQTSNTPLQALTTLNNDVFAEASRAFARRLIRLPVESDEQRLQSAFRICLSRECCDSELQQLQSLLEDAQQWYREHTDQARVLASSDAHRAGVKSDLTENLSQDNAGSTADEDPVYLASWVIVSRILLNLDEFITRE